MLWPTQKIRGNKFVLTLGETFFAGKYIINNLMMNRERRIIITLFYYRAQHICMIFRVIGWFTLLQNGRFFQIQNAFYLSKEKKTIVNYVTTK